MKNPNDGIYLQNKYQVIKMDPIKIALMYQSVMEKA